MVVWDFKGHAAKSVQPDGRSRSRSDFTHHAPFKLCVRASKGKEIAMPVKDTLQVCAKLPTPVLTVYLNTSGTDASRHPGRSAK